MTFHKIGIVGGGAWGTALAQALALADQDVVLWAFERETVDDINERHVNATFLAGVPLDPRLVATAAFADLADRDLILMVPPAQHLRRIASDLAPHLAAGTPAMICAKGIEQSTGKLLGDVLAEALPGAMVGAVSGPSFAAEVARGLPAALTVACGDPKLGERVAQTIGSLSLSLRSLADSQDQLERVIANGDVKVPAGASKEQEEKILRQAMNRPIDSGSTYVTGGDVSRFQRKSKPATGEEKAAQAAAMMTQAISAAAAASGMPAAAGAAVPAVPRGPIVRVTRGKSVEDVPVGKAQ